MTLSLNGMRASRVRLVTPYYGAWSADVDIDLGEFLDVTAGPASLVIGSTTLAGTIDPAQSGRFGPKARARVVAGGGGWERRIRSRHYKNDGGVLTTAVLATTAAEVGERFVEANPGRFGVDFIREEGPAAQVLEGLEWFVDTAGVTQVRARVEAPLPEGARVLTWDARSKVATIGVDKDEIITPGMMLTDTRFGAAKVRDVEQTWGDGGARATVSTLEPTETPPKGAGGELVAMLGAIARGASGTGWLPAFRYRVLAQAPDGRLNLQAIRSSRSNHVPDLKLIKLAPAVPGMSVKVPPGTVLHVVFADGDKSRPVVVRFEEGPTPLEVKIDAVRVGVGKLAAEPVALAVAVEAAFAAVVTYAQAVKVLLPSTTPAADALTAAMAPLVLKMPSKNLFAEGAL